MSMPVLSFPADTADRIVNGEQTVVTYGTATYAGRHLREVVSGLVGQPVAVAALPEPGRDDASGGVSATPGAIVGSATVAAVEQIVNRQREAEGLGVTRTAVILADAAPCEQRCPRCGHTDDPGQVIWPTTGCLTRCDTCEGKATCAPIPYDHPGPISEWTPRGA